MKRLFLFLTFAGFAAAQTASLAAIQLIVPLLKCSTGGPTPEFVLITGVTISCVPLPAGVTFANGVLTFPVTPTFVDGETPGGAINGTNPTFTLANTPAAGSLHLYLNGLRMCTGTCGGITADYAIAGNTITFNTPSIPQAGDILLADYRH